MAPASRIQDEGRPPVPSPPCSGTDPGSTPSAESRTWTPASSVDTPLGNQLEQEGEQNEEHDHDGAKTPRKPPVSSESGRMEEQMQKLQAKLVELEHQTISERIARQQMEQQLAVALAESMASQPLVRGFADSDRYHRVLKDVDVRCQYLDDWEEAPAGRYTDLSISLLEAQLRRLKLDRSQISQLSEDRNRLQDMKSLWEQERASLLQKLELKQVARETDSGTPASNIDNARLEESSADSGLSPVEPKLNRVTWEDWRLCHLKPAGYSAAIDVLDGEPDVSFERPVYYNPWAPSGTQAATKSRLNVPKVTSDETTGQRPMAERIRINSKHILSILSRIYESDIDGTSLVMIRPYKSLAYYDKAIRAKFLELQAEFGSKDDVMPAPSAPPAEAASKEAVSAPTAAPPGEGGTAKKPNAPDELTFSLSAYQHLKCLVQFMDDEIQGKLAYLESDRCKTVRFADIWYLFKPGDEVVDQTLRQAYRVVNVSSPGHTVISPWRTKWDKSAKAKEETPVILVCAYIDFDGKNLGPRVRKVRIPRYDNEKAVTSLEVFPLRFAEQRIRAQTSRKDGEPKMSLRDTLIKRGRRFMDMTGFKHMHYSGLTLDTRDEVDSHVVIDFQEAFAYDAQNHRKASPKTTPAEDESTEAASAKAVFAAWQPELKNLVGEQLDTKFDPEKCTAECCKAETLEKYYNDSSSETKRNQDYIQSLMPEGRGEPPPSIYTRPLQEIRNQEEEELGDADFLIMSYRVFAFILRSRKWAQLDITHLTPPDTRSSKGAFGKGVNKRQARRRVINDQKRTNRGDGNDSDQDTDLEDDTAFGQLVLPPGHKKMVRSLVSQHFRDKESKEGRQVDIVSGKGKGLIILLHGAPGVGKTTTAEGVAEKFEKPLYQITCGDLGVTAPEVEKALETSFSLASRWGCVLLLDEADVFLATRSKVDFHRNGLVSVFLRVLEYYTGVLFLTTNRIGDFDEAFASRIHISLYYPQLDIESTVEIFELNLDLIEGRFRESEKGEIHIDRPGIIKFARGYYDNPGHRDARWNGRQIRNACQTALALAEFRAHERTNKMIDSEFRETKPAVHLKVKDLKTVSNAYLEFINYLNELRGFDADAWAKRSKLRAQDVDFWRKMAELKYAEEKNNDEVKDKKKEEEKEEKKVVEVQGWDQSKTDKQGTAPSTGEVPTTVPASQQPPRGAPIPPTIKAAPPPPTAPPVQAPNPALPPGGQAPQPYGPPPGYALPYHYGHGAPPPPPGGHYPYWPHSQYQAPYPGPPPPVQGSPAPPAGEPYYPSPQLPGQGQPYPPHPPGQGQQYPPQPAGQPYQPPPGQVQPYPSQPPVQGQPYPPQPPDQPGGAPPQ